MKKTLSTLMIMMCTCEFQACNSTTKNQSADTPTDNNAITVSEDDSKFAVLAGDFNIDEVEVSYFVQDRLSNPKVKELAAMLIKEHAKINEQLMAISMKKKIPVSTSLNGKGQQAESDISQNEGSAFDKAYVVQMIKDHEDAIKLFEDAADDVNDAELKDFVTKNLPTLKKHLDALNGINDALK